MKIVITNNGSIPIYEQIKNSVKEAILAGETKEEEKLPSVRKLAKELKISILTVKKAYDELEAEGFIMTRQGLGSFIAPKNKEVEREEVLKKMEAYFVSAAELAIKWGISEEECMELFQYIYRSEKDEYD